MSEDRLDRALQEMNDEDVDSGTLEAARARVWERMTSADSATCAEFRQDFHAYLGNELGGSRRLLVEDHLSRCPGCRARIAEMKGETRVVAMPRRSSSRWVQWGALTAAAAMLLAVLYLGRDSIDGMMAPGGARATVVSADRGLYRLTPCPPTCPRAARRRRDLSKQAPPSANGSRSAPARERMRCCGSPTDRSWTSTSEPNCS